MIEMIYADGKAEYEALKKLRDRAAQAGAENRSRCADHYGGRAHAGV